MAKEPDQTKWVGIRPTDPSENIPVTESAPLTDIKVSPSAGNPQFETLTKKRAPAIGDLSAITSTFQEQESGAGVDCRVSYADWMTTVPADEIQIVSSITMINETSMCDMIISVVMSGAGETFCGWFSVPPGIIKIWTGQLVLMPDDRITAKWYLGGATDDVEITSRCHIVTPYT